MRSNLKTYLFISLFSIIASSTQIGAWSWNTSDNVLPSVREDLDKEVAAYRQQVGNGMTLQERIIVLDRLIGNYEPLGLNIAELKIERSRLILQDKQAQLRNLEAQGEATKLYERGVGEYRSGQFRDALETFRIAERQLPDDSAIKEVRRKLEGVTPILEIETAQDFEGKIIRLSITRFLENDPKRALNAIMYASESKVNRPELIRLQRLIEKNHPEAEMPARPRGISLVDYKLQATLEAIYDGRYLTAISECTDVLDLEPDNVLALTRLGSAYYAMNEKDKAKNIWTMALQLDPSNEVLKKFLYGTDRGRKVETRR